VIALEVDVDSQVPVYRQIVEGVRGLIARGTLADGAELPSVRDLGSRIGVNLNTVARAYRILADEGLVDLRHGSRARVRLGPAPAGPAVDAEGARRLDEVIGRWLLRGAGRREVERALRDAVDRFYRRT
jgi:GntR family transcriptional regulator